MSFSTDGSLPIPVRLRPASISTSSWLSVGLTGAFSEMFACPCDASIEASALISSPVGLDTNPSSLLSVVGWLEFASA